MYILYVQSNISISINIYYIYYYIKYILYL